MAKKQRQVQGNFVDVVKGEIYPAAVTIQGDTIQKIEKQDAEYEQYIMPGLIDAHVHIESSMLIPSEFARLAVVHGTIGTVSDPHEIGNVIGTEGVEYMIDNGKKVPFYFNFGAPSCVPATPFETAGAEIGPDAISDLLKRDDIKYLSEMMNYPGVINKDEEVWKKLMVAKKLQKPMDGHSPGIRGEEARKYIEAGISTDHECYTKDEALDKLKYGMNIIIREGSAAKNFEALINLVDEFPEKIMFCSDDKHPDDLVKNHINELLRRAINDEGLDTMKVIKAATQNPVNHYGLECGLAQEGDKANFIVVDNLEHFGVKQTYIDGQVVAEDGKTKIKPVKEKPINNFENDAIDTSDISIFADSDWVQAILPQDGELVTMGEKAQIIQKKGYAYSNPDEDVLKIVAVNRYEDEEPAVAFIKNFGLKEGAIASSVAHDSHNVLAVGVNDEDITTAVNQVMAHKGGISVASGGKQDILPLPVAGLMSNEDGSWVAEQYEALDKQAKDFGSQLTAPFMTLSFMGLLVIPELKLSDQGLFDSNNFDFTEVFMED